MNFRFEFYVAGSGFLQGDRSVSQDDNPVSVCSPETRLAYLHASCPPQSESLDQWLDSLSLFELKQFTSQWYVDESHKVLGCLHSKVGSTTWAAILCNNSMENPLPKYTRFFRQCMDKNRIYHLGDHKEYTKEDIVHRIKTYYKFMVVRHPLDRLVSAWIDKFLHPKDFDYILLNRHGPAILSKYRPWLSEAQIKSGKGVFFQEMIQYILAGHQNAHWDGPYSRTCQPCRINFDAIVKLETFNSDVAPIINNKLKGRSIGTVVNKHGKTSWDKQFVKVLSEYKNVSKADFENTVKKYMDDFIQYGYGFQRMEDGNVKASCYLGNGTHSCC